MALPPNASTDVFLREVDEEVRRDRLNAFWTRWGKVAIAAVLLGLVAFAGFLYWQHRRQQAAGIEGERMQAAFDQLAQNRAAQAAPVLADLARSDRAGYRALAKFTQADVLLTRDDLRGAAALFGQIAADQSLAQPFRDLALLRQTAAELDTLRPQVVVERMRPLAVPGAAYLGSAGEMMGLAQVRLGQRAAAAQLFGRIAADASVPETIRQRAVQMAGLLGNDAPAATPAATNNQDSGR